MSLFTAQVANYFGKGNTRTCYQNGGWSLNVLCLKLGRYRLRVVQDRKVIANKIKRKGSIYTTDIEVAGVKKFEEGVRVVNDLCRLLSLASFSQVAPFQYSFPPIFALGDLRLKQFGFLLFKLFLCQCAFLFQLPKPRDLL